MDPATRLGVVLAGKYRLERLLGVGGMGAVYEAVHVGVEKRFAVKLLRPDSARAPDSAQRFTQEARAAARIGHPNLVEVFDLGETEDGTLFMVMELLTGRSLADALKDGPLPVAQATEIAVALLGALAAAHKAGFVHRDIKPGNIFLADRGAGQISVKVLDFGIAKLVEPDGPHLTQSGVAVGTPLYMAPEQVLAEREVDGRADVWAVGATLFEMLAGRPVHLATSVTAAAVKVVTERAPRVHTLRAEVDTGLDAVVARALAVSRDERFGGAEEMRAALETCRAGIAPTLIDSGLTPSVATVVRGELAARAGRRSLVALGAVSLIVGAGGFWLIARGETRGTAARATAPVEVETVVPAEAVPVAEETAAIPAPSATATATATTMSTSASTTTTTSTSASMSSPPRVARPSCAANERLSRGHCCAVGLEWQGDHCDRPLATKAPF